MSETATSEWTIRKLLDWTEGFFRRKGVESPRLEAQLLLAHALKCRKTDLFVRYDEAPDEGPRAQFRDLVQQRATGCPVHYLIGQREFYLLFFEVTPAVLIPRPETELLVMECLKEVRNRPAPRILDLGTGSGCIAVSVAHGHKFATVVATDISADALTVASRNAHKHGVADRLVFREGDLFDAVDVDERFDFIVSNAPYIPTDHIATLDRSVRDFEPRLALDGGRDGLDVYRRLIPEALAYLEPNGSLLIEIGVGQRDAVESLIRQTGGYGEIVVLSDQAGHPRVLRANAPRA